MKRDLGVKKTADIGTALKSAAAAASAAIILIFAVMSIYYISGLGGAANATKTVNGTTYMLGAPSVYYRGQRVSNFLIEYVNPGNVTGLIYVLYPLAAMQGTQRTLRIGDTVGYNCDGSLKMLTSINYGLGSATFTNASTGSRYGGCPI